MSSSSGDNYVNRTYSPYYPPPSFNINFSWGYPWNSSENQTLTNSHNDQNLMPPPPPPPYPPPQQPPPPPGTPPPEVTPPAIKPSKVTPQPRVSTSPSRGAPSSTVVQPSPSRVQPSISRAVPNPRVTTSVNGIGPVNTEKHTNYYNTSPPSAYHPRRYISNSNSHYVGTNTNHYTTEHGQYPPTSPNKYNIMHPGSYMNPVQCYNRNFYGKRKPDNELDISKKGIIIKRRKNRLSQNIPQRKDWSVADAIRALTVEKEYNKRNKSQSLIIKFPDLELNREIVSKFHSTIENVHFQQPSTPRFCFVTLNENADPKAVIKDLNKIPFGSGFLSVEYKKDREDEVNLGPEDIDPMTLYVGNLAQEVTKQDMVNLYPRQKRTDIGYAKKMKYTRYAFISFKSVDDCIEAFKKTHAKQMYSKSLIVRLNGTVGMPGEPKPQMPPKSHDAEPKDHQSYSPYSENIDISNDMDLDQSEAITPLAPWEMVDVSKWETSMKVKDEPSDDTDEEDEQKPPVEELVTPFMPGSLELAFSQHKPKLKVEVKNENDTAHTSHESWNKTKRKPIVHNIEDDSSISPPETVSVKEELVKTESSNTYQALRSLNRANKGIDFTPVKVEKDCSPTTDDRSTDSEDKMLRTDEEVTVKSEPYNEDDEMNDGDCDSSGEEEDFSFNNLLRSLEAKKKVQQNNIFP
ncbi:hypothetical protein NQ317_001322 [Molorchus minor]|uniref:RRM domain-containing protein n=1 Tax=Molorchus minor TaxID=1323400 RepID=A0ABQ9J875_9CUCU|nr:hypothetical protein NQ317_001322 [Molorchus minor]